MLHSRRLEPQILSLRRSTTNNHLHPCAKGIATDFWFYQAFKPSHIALNNSTFSSLKAPHHHPGCIFPSSRIAICHLDFIAWATTWAQNHLLKVSRGLPISGI